jgi:SAM-dependent methyltransferase
LIVNSFEFPGAYYEIMRRDMRDLAGETDFLGSYLPAGGRVLDLGSGTGTNLRALAERGFTGIGVDHSALFIDHAKNAGITGVEYVWEDLAKFHTSETFDLVHSLFGVPNLLSHTDLQSLLDRVGGWLRPGGHLVLDIAHLLNFVDGYQPAVVAHHRGDGLLMTRLARQLLHPHNGTWRNDETLLVREPDGRVAMYENVFDQIVLTTPELRMMLRAAGLKIVDEFGSFRRDPVSRTGRGPLIIVAQSAG